MGYLQALIDRYHKLYMASTDPVRQNIYKGILSDLRNMQSYINTKEDTKQDDVKPLESAEKTKYIAFTFSGKMPDFMEFMKSKMQAE